MGWEFQLLNAKYADAGWCQSEWIQIYCISVFQYFSIQDSVFIAVESQAVVTVSAVQSRQAVREL